MKLRHIYSDTNGEVEGMFSETGELLGYWWCDDAMWRNEYFRGFMRKLGIEVESSDDPKLRKKLDRASKQ